MLPGSRASTLAATCALAHRRSRRPFGEVGQAIDAGLGNAARFGETRRTTRRQRDAVIGFARLARLAAGRRSCRRHSSAWHVHCRSGFPSATNFAWISSDFGSGRGSRTDRDRVTIAPQRRQRLRINLRQLGWPGSFVGQYTVACAQSASMTPTVDTAARVLFFRTASVTFSASLANGHRFGDIQIAARLIRQCGQQPAIILRADRVAAHGMCAAR